MTRGSTANYNRLILDLLKLVDLNISNADQVVIDHLSSLEGNTVAWPSDKVMVDYLSAIPSYGNGRVARSTISNASRLVENVWRLPKGEGALAAESDLQLEHMLPQTWEE